MATYSQNTPSGVTLNASAGEAWAGTSVPVPPPYTNADQYPPASKAPGLQYYPPSGQNPPPPAGFVPQYYPPPQGELSYPPRPSYQSQQQQQQQSVVVLQQSAVAPVGMVPYVSFTGAIVLSCLVFWFCGWLFGGIAFILAMVGQSSAAAGDIRGAIQMRNASYGLSIAGIVIGVIIIAVIAGVLGAAANSAYYNYYYYYSRYKTCSGYNYYYSYYGTVYYYSCRK